MISIFKFYILYSLHYLFYSKNTDKGYRFLLIIDGLPVHILYS